MSIEAVKQPENPPSFLPRFHAWQGECFLLAFAGAQRVCTRRHSGRASFILPVELQREGEPDGLAPPLEAITLEITPGNCDRQENECQDIIDDAGRLVLGGQQGMSR